MPRRPLIWILGIWILGGVVAASLGLEPQSRTPLDEAVGELSSVSVIAEGTIRQMRGGAGEKLVLDECVVFVGGAAGGSDESAYQTAAALDMQTLAPVYETHKLLVYGDGQIQSGPLDEEEVLFCELTAGMRIRITGTLYNWESPDNPGEFNLRRYYRTRGLDYSLYADEISVVEAAPSFNFDAFLDEIYFDIEALIDELASSEEEAGFEKAIILGDRSELSGELEDDFRLSGISHVLAISGLHLSLMGMAVFRLLKKLGAPQVASSLIADALLLFYVVMISGSASAWRAFIMFTLMLLAPLLRRSYDNLSALAVAGMLLIITEPMYLLDGGFQLSFAAIAGIGGVYPKLKKLLPKMSKPLPALNRRDKLQDFLVLVRRRILESLLFGLSIQLATLPVAAYQYYTVSPYGLVLNLIVVPLAGVMLGSYLLGTIIGSAYYMAGVFTAGAGHFAYEFLSAISAFTAKLPGASLVIGRPELWQIMLYYVLLLTGLLLLEKLARRGRSNMTLLFLLPALLSEKPARRGRKKAKPSLRAVRCFFFIFILALPLVLIRRPAQELSITNLYVGQGDCTVICREGRTMLIDCGSSSKTEAGSRVILPYLKSCGISGVDLVVLTHSDLDHVSALSELFADPAVSIDAVAIPLATAESENWTELLAVIETSSSKLFFLSAGDEIRLGSAMLTVLYPGRTTSLDEGNDTSLVLALHDGDFSALFAGDISSEVEEELISVLSGTFSLPEMQDQAQSTIRSQSQSQSQFLSQSRTLSSSQHFDYLKVAHHGSKYSSSADFLAAICPRVSVISVGRNNYYGHPSADALERLTAAGCSIFRTDCDGAVTTLLSEDGSIFVSGFR